MARLGNADEGRNFGQLKDVRELVEQQRNDRRRLTDRFLVVGRAGVALQVPPPPIYAVSDPTCAHVR